MFSKHSYYCFTFLSWVERSQDFTPVTDLYRPLPTLNLLFIVFQPDGWFLLSDWSWCRGWCVCHCCLVWCNQIWIIWMVEDLFPSRIRSVWLTVTICWVVRTDVNCIAPVLSSMWSTDNEWPFTYFVSYLALFPKTVVRPFKEDRVLHFNGWSVLACLVMVLFDGFVATKLLVLDLF